VGILVGLSTVIVAVAVFDSYLCLVMGIINCFIGLLAVFPGWQYLTTFHISDNLAY